MFSKIIREELKLLLILVFIVFKITCHSQKYDYVWLSGKESWAGYDSVNGFYWGTSVLDFNQSPREVRYDSMTMNFDLTNISFSTFEGQLLFYSNGVSLGNNFNTSIENSDSLNAGYMLNQAYPEMLTYGYRIAQGMLAIPNPKSANQYYIFHSWIDSVAGGNICKKILLTTLDMNANNGNGAVIDKNIPLIEGSWGAHLTAVRHGNGRDWWLIIQKANSNCFQKILVDSIGVSTTNPFICTGDTFSLYGGASCFSSDGSKFIYGNPEGIIDVYDFDRCTGQLSNAVTINIPNLPQLGSVGLSISPNNRYLYVAIVFNILQFDLYAPDIPASRDTIGTIPLVGYNVIALQLGPDGKIYGDTWDGNVYHVINRPDEKGDSCNFQYCGLPIPSLNTSVHHFPNYRLGSLSGSPCDTLGILSVVDRAEKERVIKIFPNPASDMITVDYGFTDWSKGEVILEMTNELGQNILSQQLAMYSGLQKINVAFYPAGIYTVTLKRSNTVIAYAKFVKE